MVSSASWSAPPDPCQSESLIELCQYIPVPPPSPKVYPQGGYSHDTNLKRKLQSLDESVFKPTPLRRVLSIDDEDEEVDLKGDEGGEMAASFVQSDANNRWICLWPECSEAFSRKKIAELHLQNHLYAGEHEDFYDDATTAVGSSNLSSSRCSHVDTPPAEVPSCKKCFAIRSRARKDQPSSETKSDNAIPATQLSIADKHISPPILTNSSATPEISLSNTGLAASTNVHTWPQRGSYCLSRQSPPISREEGLEASHWSDGREGRLFETLSVRDVSGQSAKAKI